MIKPGDYTITAELWKWQSEKAAWHFLTIPKDISDVIKFSTEPGAGFGSIKVEVNINKTTWRTSIFPSKSGEFHLPVKASVRKAENLTEGTKTTFTITTKH